MELIFERPVERFLGSIGKHPIEMLNGAYPFVTWNIVESLLIPWLKHKKTRLVLICNLSPFVVATSFADPAEPLIRLMNALETRVEIRSHPQLHAKAFIADSRVAIFGSSNLTMGGELANREVNALVVHSLKAQRERIRELTNWFVQLKEEASPVDRTLLSQLSQEWNKQKRIRAQILAESPEARLGDDYWSKVKHLARRKRSSKADVEALLSGGSDDIDSKPRNLGKKLLFLRDAGVVSRWDKKWVYRADSAKELTSTPERFYERLRLLLPVMTRVLEQVISNPDAGYSLLEKELRNEAKVDDIHIAANWLWRLGFLRLDKAGGTYSFRCTASGRRVLNTPSPSPTPPAPPS